VGATVALLCRFGCPLAARFKVARRPALRDACVVIWSAALLALAACSTSPTSAIPPLPDFDAVAAVAAIRAAGGADATELDVQPLRDPQVEDLRQQAAALEAALQYRDAAAALDSALAINADDPALLQERAEIALLLRQLPEAERLAQRAFATGSKVGPLCRRHWETVAQVRVNQPQTGTQAQAGTGAVATAAAARRQRDACTVAAPNRF